MHICLQFPLSLSLYLSLYILYIYIYAFSPDRVGEVVLIGDSGVGKSNLLSRPRGGNNDKHTTTTTSNTNSTNDNTHHTNNTSNDHNTNNTNKTIRIRTIVNMILLS